MGFADCIGRPCYSDWVIPDRLHKALDFISKGLTQDILPKANWIVLILVKGIIFAKPLIKRNAQLLVQIAFG